LIFSVAGAVELSLSLVFLSADLFQFCSYISKVRFLHQLFEKLS
jgi:hypothetical protein